MDRWLLYRSPDAEDGGGEAAGASGESDNQEGAAEASVTMTQAELDRMIAKRVARAEKAAAERLKAEQEQASLSETEKLKAERDKAVQAATEAQSAANARLVRAEALGALADAGIPSEKRARALKLLELDQVDVSEAGEVDAAGLKGQVDALLKDWPELKPAQGAANGGMDTSAGGGTQPDPAQMTMDEYVRWRKGQT